MNFWNKDLLRGEKDIRKKLALSDWSLMVMFAIITWILASIFAHLGGVNWVISQFVSALVTGTTIFFLIGTWMYPTIAEIPIRKQGIRFLGFVLLGAFSLDLNCILEIRIFIKLSLTGSNLMENGIDQGSV